MPSVAGLLRRAAGTDTMRAWERFLTGEPDAAAPAGNYVVTSWQRSLRLGVDPTGRAAPLAAQGEALHLLRHRHRDLLAAAAGVFAEATELLAGSRSIMLLTDPDGVVLDAIGDRQTLELGQDIHLMRGGDWREDVIGTNGIGTALATGRPAQVHASEHFCEGIKAWTCAAAPIHEPGTLTIVGVVDISGPPSTYQRNNLTLAVATARQIEAALGERAAQERMRLLEVCLHEIATGGAAGLIALDRSGRLVHATGRIPGDIAIGERVPGLHRGMAMQDWANHLPEGWRPEWLNLVSAGSDTVGAVLVIPGTIRPLAGRGPPRGSEGDPDRNSFAHIIGRGAAMTALIQRAGQLVRRRVPVLIDGETGVGKELLARAIHGDASGNDPGEGDANGRRPFIAFNCAAVSKELVAGELFGHVRGAFTGATSDGRPGRFELAHEGTLCLDEIGDMPLDLQPVLLRVLEEGIVYRLGDTQLRRVNVRLIAVTNRNLRDEVEAGRFRRDLFYRISVAVLTIPPLRERAEDIETLVEHFNRRLAARHRTAMLAFDPEAMTAMRSWPWPGNVRELRNVIERLLLTGRDGHVTIETVRQELIGTAPAAAASIAAPVSLEAVERDAISRALEDAGGNFAGAARRGAWAFHAARSIARSAATDYRRVRRRDYETAWIRRRMLSGHSRRRGVAGTFTCGSDRRSRCRGRPGRCHDPPGRCHGRPRRHGRRRRCWSRCCRWTCRGRAAPPAASLS